jgi:hypothetical protein
MDKFVPSFMIKRKIPIIPTRNGFTLKNGKKFPFAFSHWLVFPKGLWGQFGERKRKTKFALCVCFAVFALVFLVVLLFASISARCRKRTDREQRACRKTQLASSLPVGFPGPSALFVSSVAMQSRPKQGKVKSKSSREGDDHGFPSSKYVKK